MEIPSIVIPPVKDIETISIPLPTADVPSYVPLVVPPSDSKRTRGYKTCRNCGTSSTYTKLAVY